MLAALSSYVNSDTLSQVGCWGLQCNNDPYDRSCPHFWLITEMFASADIQFDQIMTHSLGKDNFSPKRPNTVS